MNKKIKAIILLLTTILILSVSIVPSEASGRKLTLTTTGTVSIKAKNFNIYVNITEIGLSNAESLDKLKESTTKYRSILKKFNIPSESIISENISTYEDFIYGDSTTPSMAGETNGGVAPVNPIYGKKVFRSTQNYNIKVASNFDFNSFLTEISQVSTGVTSSISSSYESNDVYYNQAVKKAINLSKNRATYIAKSLKLRVGKAYAIKEGSTSYPRYALSAEKITDSNSTIEITPGNQEISVTLTIVWDLY